MPEPINVKDTWYYISSELELSEPDLYRNARKTKNRNIIITLEIPDTEYIFAYRAKMGTVWNVLTAKSKIAKLLISKEWMNTFLKNRQNRHVIRRASTPLPISTSSKESAFADSIKLALPTSIVETNVNDNFVDVIVDTKVDDDVLEDNDESIIIEPVPPVLHLNENEKFRDVDGCILEIMTCGERHEDRIYFDMTDVSKAFELSNLRKSLQHKNGAYTREVDYTVFRIGKQGATNSKVANMTTNKRMFLTHNGLLKVVNVSRPSINQECIQSWLRTLNLDFSKNVKHILKPVKKDKTGTIYIATVSCLDAVKIGYTTASYSTLHSRYKMVYGADVEIHHKCVDNAQIVEKEFHTAFKDYNMSGELFNKNGYNLYQDYLNALLTIN